MHINYYDGIQSAHKKNNENTRISPKDVLYSCFEGIYINFQNKITKLTGTIPSIPYTCI